MPKKVIFALTILFASLIIAFGALFFLTDTNETIIQPLVEEIQTPLLAYSFENLRKTEIPGSAITLGRETEETDDYISQLFYYETPESPGEDNMLIVSGLANVPKEPGNYPVVIMTRGFIPQASFVSGAGSQPTARRLAGSGFITLAPDFLGFGESDASADSFEGRFQTYTTAISLLKSLDNLNDALAASYSGAITADTDKIGMWGHSNGGHIALSTLAITGKSYPTVLWAPVSKYFPYSILYYTDEYDDQGKSMRKSLANFEDIYDTEVFSPPNYYEWINTEFQIHQGQDDKEILAFWTDELVESLREEEVDEDDEDKNEVEYFTYPNANHNLLPDGWSTAVARTITFFTERLKN